jgi:hypothetical protein
VARAIVASCILFRPETLIAAGCLAFRPRDRQAEGRVFAARGAAGGAAGRAPGAAQAAPADGWERLSADVATLRADVEDLKLKSGSGGAKEPPFRTE